MHTDIIGPKEINNITNLHVFYNAADIFLFGIDFNFIYLFIYSTWFYRINGLGYLR